MTDFDTLPDAVDADYTQWNEDTVVELHSVAWNNDYRDIVDWKTAQARSAWFDNRPVSARTKIENLSYARINAPISLEIPFSTAYRYNYVRVINGPQTPVFNPRNEFFYFITNIQPLAPGTTLITVQLDVWTSFFQDVTFGQCFVERGHLGIANSNNFANFGRDFLTVPEGMDIGNEYQVAHHINRDIMSSTGDGFGDFMIMVASTVQFESGSGTVNNPDLHTAEGDNVQGMPSGASYYLFTLQNFRNFLKAYSGKPWVTQGIISISAIPTPFRYGNIAKAVTVPGVPIGTVLRITQNKPAGIGFNMAPKWRDNVNLLNMIPAKYRKLKKFFTSPYMMLELTNFAGSPVILKPELWNDPDGWISEKATFAAPNQRIVHVPVKYNAGRNSTIVEKVPAGPGPGGTIYDDNGEYLDVNVTTTNLPTFALVNNGYLAFMASNANSIGQSFEQADWSQQKALQGNQVSYDQANSSIATGAANAMTGRNLAIDQNHQANDYAWRRTGLGAAGAIAGKNIAGAAMGVLGNVVDQNNRNIMTGLSNNAAADIQGATQQNQQYLADTNKGLADFAARGDYAQSVAAINAKLQDARLTQPSVSGQAGGDTFNLIHGGMILSLRFKMISYNAMCIIGDYWLRYGYAINRYLRIDKLSVMTNFTYWKVSELYLVNTPLPEFIKQAIRGIFEKGVTVHTSPDRIGTIDISVNEPLSGIVIPVDPVPEIVPPTPEPLNPNLDEVDEMYLVKTTNVNGDQFWGIGKEYLNSLNTTNTGTEIPVKLVGQEFTSMTLAEFASALRFAGIPDRYVDLATFVNENPSGTWSKSELNALALADVQTAMAANQESNNTNFSAILTLISPPDSGTGTN